MSRRGEKGTDDLVISRAYWFVAVLAASSILAVWVIPEFQTNDFKDQNEARKTLVQICGGCFAVLVFLVGVAKVRTSHRDLEIQQAGEMNNRYIQFIGQLGTLQDRTRGTPNIETRCGAIYGLQRLAEDSVADYATIMNYLARYVRMCTPGNNLRTGEIAPGADIPFQYSRLRVDIQTAMEVVARSSPHRGMERPKLDLSETYLDNLILERADLRGANLRLASLRNAALANARLGKALLVSTELDGANLAEADLCGADLSGSRLVGARLERARFDPKTKFMNADLEGAWFYSDEARSSSEFQRGLTIQQVLDARNWDLATFSPGFTEGLQAEQSAQAGGQAEA